MKWKGIVKYLDEHKGAIYPIQGHGNEEIIIPIKYLPKNCRVGDVLQFNVSFDPFQTLNTLRIG